MTTASARGSSSSTSFGGADLRVVDVDGQEAPVYRRDGDGEAELVLLHGGFTDPAGDFARLLAHLDARLSVTMPILSGHEGRPSSSEDPVGPASIAQETKALVEAMELERPVLGGFSLGARGAMLAASLGVPTAALVLIGTRFVRFDAGEFDALRRQAMRHLPYWASDERRSAIAAMAAGIVDFEIDSDAWGANLGGLPVLAIRGGDDSISTEPEMARFESLPMPARIVSIPGHAHRVQRSAAAEVGSLINDFLAETGVLA